MLTGGCACGRIRYEAGGEPLFSVICHCRDCQRASGTGGVPVMGVTKAGFTVKGEPAQFAGTGGSGQPAIRHFCPACGSLLFGTPQSAPGMVTLYVGSLDDPHQFQPQQAIFTRDRPHWARLATTLTEFPALPARAQ
jgi:hypothetical protein